MAKKSAHSNTDLIGVISDTHGLMRPEALAALAGSALIIHAGDIGGLNILDELREIAPVAAVRGNNDNGEWAGELQKTEVVRSQGVSIFVLHDVKQMEVDPIPAGYGVVISGHSHRPSIEMRPNGVMFLNPGSAGPRRFRLPIAVAQLRIKDGKIDPRVIQLL